MAKKMRKFTAVYKKSGKWYLAWVEEIPGVNTQGKTLREAKKNLKEAVKLVLDASKELGKAGGDVIREPLLVAI